MIELLLIGFLFIIIVTVMFTYRCFTGDRYRNHPYVPDRHIPSEPNARCIELDGRWERVRNGGAGQSVRWLDMVPDKSPEDYDAQKSWEWLQDEKRKLRSKKNVL